MCVCVPVHPILDRGKPGHSSSSLTKTVCARGRGRDFCLLSHCANYCLCKKQCRKQGCSQPTRRRGAGVLRGVERRRPSTSLWSLLFLHSPSSSYSPSSSLKRALAAASIAPGSAKVLETIPSPASGGVGHEGVDFVRLLASRSDERVGVARSRRAESKPEQGAVAHVLHIRQALAAVPACAGRGGGRGR
jgi:hypothetical protein